MRAERPPPQHDYRPTHLDCKKPRLTSFSNRPSNCLSSLPCFSTSMMTAFSCFILSVTLPARRSDFVFSWFDLEGEACSGQGNDRSRNSRTRGQLVQEVMGCSEDQHAQLRRVIQAVRIQIPGCLVIGTLPGVRGRRGLVQMLAGQTRFNFASTRVVRCHLSRETCLS
jgi:hypothetical protein